MEHSWIIFPYFAFIYLLRCWKAIEISIISKLCIMLTTSITPEYSNIKRKAYISLILFIIALFMIYWLVSGTILYWEAWFYLIGYSIFKILLIQFLLTNNPELLKKRLTFKEKENKQQKLIWFGGLNYFLMYGIPAIDRRFEWSILSYWLIIVGWIILITGMYINYKVYQTNPWSSVAIQVQDEQSVIDTGVYGIVRHPLYLAGWLGAIGTVLVLGSYWGLIAAIGWLIMFTLRLLDEEKMLIQDLPGYADYCKKVKYRLIPGIF